MRYQPANADTFFPEFFGSLFAPQDHVVLAMLEPQGEARPVWRNVDCSTLAQAIETALRWQAEGRPNLYFRASGFDGSGGYGTANCRRIAGFFLDIDFGSEGHKKESLFATRDAALAHLLTMPLRPSVAWCTGHGIQACYLLDQPYEFTGGTPAEGGQRLAEFTAISSKLSDMALSDRTHTPEHAFRIPLSVNSKAHDFPGLPDVAGTLLWFRPDTRYSFADIKQACDNYGAEDLMKWEGQDEPSGGEESDEDGLRDCPYEELAVDLREDIESDGERSNRLFSIIIRMVRRHYSDACINRAVRHGQSFQTYGEPDLQRHIDRCFDKIRADRERYVYSSDQAPPLRFPNMTTEVPLHDCTPLPPALRDMLGCYGAETGARLTDRVYMAARFHESVFSSESASGVIESPCGSGKSTWALSHIALNARPDQRYIYVVETVDALYRAADTLEKLCDTPVGRVHGFNADKCQALCGMTRRWQDCGPNHPDSLCHPCAQNSQCRFYNRDAEEGKPILVMTHSGLCRLLEQDRAGIMAGARIIVDEDLSALNSTEFALEDFDCLRALDGGAALEVGKLFPYSWLAHKSALLSYGVNQTEETFAQRNYVFRDETETASLASLYDDMRKVAARKPQPANPFRPGDTERAREVLGQLMNFFRPDDNSRATYAFREIVRDGQLVYSVTRSRFDLGAGQSFSKLWILNASARLSPNAYPENMPVYACPDLPESSHLLTIHVVGHNPTKARQADNIKLSKMLLHYAPNLRDHKSVFVATDKGQGSARKIEAQLRELHGADAKITVLSRGRIKGSNEAGDCTLAYLTGMAFFTTLTDCALRATLQIRRTFPDVPVIFKKKDQLNWSSGTPCFPVLRNIYALRALDEIYQTIWRTAVRNDRRADAIIAVPDPEWLTALWRTVAPRFNMGNAYKAKHGLRVVPVYDNPPSTERTNIEYVSLGLIADQRMEGLCVVNTPPGAVLTKTLVTNTFGYFGQRPWEKNSQTLRRLLDPFFEDTKHKTLVRRPFRGMRLLTQRKEGDGTYECINVTAREIVEIINDAAQVYKGAGCGGMHHHEVKLKAINKDIQAGVGFWGIDHDDRLSGVVGLQYIGKAVLIRYAHVRRDCMRKGLASRLMRYLLTCVRVPCFAMVHANAHWAIRFFESIGFQQVSAPELRDMFAGCRELDFNHSVILCSTDPE